MKKQSGNTNLSLALLGSPQITLAGDSLLSRLTVKAQALLIYIAIESATSHRRDHLAGLLWPEHEQVAARNSLRQALHQLRRALGKSSKQFLFVSRETVQFNPASDYMLDVTKFSELILACDKHTHRRSETCRSCTARSKQAVDLYHGDFLSGFYLKDSVAFEEWALIKREQCRRQAVSALHLLTDHHCLRCDYENMEHYARRQIEIDPFREEAHRQVMRALAWQGQRNATLAHYETLRQMLDQELGVVPEEETTNLRSKVEMDYLEPPTSPPLRNWPSRLTPFYGREKELEQIVEHLQSPDVHLVTIIGPGGIGKTRLALKAAELGVDSFRDGACFVSLTEVSTPESALSAIAGVLNVVFSDSSDPKEQLLNYLQRKDMLIVLDGLEHMAEESGLVIDLLRVSPAIKILVTSREGLNLQREWRLPIQGLSFPISESVAEFENYDAVRLFRQRARKVRPEFALSEANRPAIARICELVDGMPLALELAAGWIKVLTCTQIADEIERGVSFLTTSMRDVPERHRSIHAVFERSWDMLSVDEQIILRQLAVFIGEFHPEAAQAVVSLKQTSNVDQQSLHWETKSDGISYPVHTLLASIVDKSLLQVAPSGYYQQQSLVRQYALEKLAEYPEEMKQTQDRHGRYYAQKLSVLGQKLKTTEQKQAFKALNAEIENLRAAWNWAISCRQWPEIGQCLAGLPLLYRSQGWWLEGEAVMSQAVDKLSENVNDEDIADSLKAIVLGVAMLAHGVCCVHISRFAQAEDVLKQSLSLLQSAEAHRSIAMPLGWLGTAESAQGKHDIGAEHLRQGLAMAREYGDQWTIAMLLLLSAHHIRMRDIMEAAEHYRASLSIFQDLDDLRGMTTPHYFLGEMMLLSGNLEEAGPHLEESLALAREAEAPQPESWSLASLGFVAFHAQNYSKAKELFQESLVLAAEIGDIRIMIADHLGLGSVASALHNDAAAEDHLLKSLRMAAKARYWRQLVRSLNAWAAYLAGKGEAEKIQAAALLTHVIEHPRAWQEHRILAENLLEALRADLPSKVFEEALQRGREGTLESAVERIAGLAWQS